MDGSGEIDYIKIQPERNRNSDKILQIVQSNNSFFGIKISYIEQGTEHREGGGFINYIKFIVVN